MRTFWIVSPALVALASLLSARAARAADVIIDWSDTKQTVSGFGASSAWFGVNLSDDVTRSLFDPKTGIGLSLLRIQIGLPADIQSDGTEPTDAGAPVATTPELTTAQQALSYGCRIWATAWTPPPAWKTTNSQNGSGPGFDSNKLLPEHYQDYAEYLADFVAVMAENNVPLVGVSPANEPDYVATWDNAQWSGSEMTTFVADYLGPTFARRCPSVKIIVPDTAHWDNCDSYVTPISENATALGYTSVFATHPYPTGAEAPDWTYNKPQQLGKEFWETEWSQENMAGDTPDPTMTSAIDMAEHIHTNMVTTQMNAWNWWAIYTSADSLLTQDPNGVRENPALIQPDESMNKPYMFQRGYALGNWAKFVRPGFKRLGTTDPSSSLLVEAYRDECHIALIAINRDANEVSQKFTLSGAPFVTSLTPWITSANDKLAAKSEVPVSDGSFTATVPGRSVVTFVNWNASNYTPGGSEETAAGTGCPAATGGQSSVDAGAQTAGSGGAGNGGDSATTSVTSNGNKDSGCGCRVGGVRRTSTALGFTALFLTVLSLRRRRSRS